jgi:hypothetical protein
MAGNLKAAFAWDASSKQLAVRLRQSVETGRKVEFKYKVGLNASTSTCPHCMRLHHACNVIYVSMQLS